MGSLDSCMACSNDHDINGERRGYKGISIPTARRVVTRGGILEMDDPEHRVYRNVFNPYLSPAAVKRTSCLLRKKSGVPTSSSSRLI